jgi:hypothetical protein
MVDPQDENATLPLPVTAECVHSLRLISEKGQFIAHLTTDLLGDWILMQSAGRMSRPVGTVEEGVTMLTMIAKR